MTRYIDITLTKRGVACTAQLLDDIAPLTCDAVWDALPLENGVYHAKYARNEIYTLVDSFAEVEPTLENPTITPIPGDIMYFTFAPWQLTPKSHGYSTAAGKPDSAAASSGHSAGSAPGTKVDLALFYERNNLLLNPDFGFVPGSVFATIVRGLDAIAEASQDLWRHGADGETLRFERRAGGL